MKLRDERRYQPNPRWRETGRLHARLASTRRRIDGAREALRAATEAGRLVVASSWGKDSTVLLDLATEVLGPVDVLYLESGYEMPGTEEQIAYWSGRGCRVQRVPGRGLAETIAWLHDVGLGWEREDQSAASRSKATRAETWCAEHGFDVSILGLRAEESIHRRIRSAHYGLVYRRRDGHTVATPLAWWTAADVWSWIACRDLPYLPLYDAETHGLSRYTLRNTGWLTTVDVDRRMPWLREHYPDLWRRLTDEFPHMRTF